MWCRKVCSFLNCRGSSPDPKHLILLPAFALCRAFNLDTENPMTFQENARGFGQSVVQFEGSRQRESGSPVSAQSENSTSDTLSSFHPLESDHVHSISAVPMEAVNMSLGLSLATAINPSQLLACGPTVHQTCKENTYVNGFCFLFGSNLLRQPQRFPEALRACPQQESDIAFLIDGSGSIIENDFRKMKDFVSTVMDQFKKSKTLFSLMQYSNEFQTHFTFNYFKKNPNPRLLVNQIRQLQGTTYTATGIRKVVRELFQSANGARENAVKILVVITDGEKYQDPLNYEDVIPEADRKGVIRYVIGVGNVSLGLVLLLWISTWTYPPFNLQILVKSVRQGFLLTQTDLCISYLFFDWAGGAFLHRSKNEITFINTTRVDSDMNDAYLGYASAVILRNRVQSLVLGAPRYQHIGLVAMFRQNAGAWETNTIIKGNQIGSYFGASLCSVDMDGDGNTNLVLIGAPHFYEQMRGGQVSVCPLPKGRMRFSRINIAQPGVGKARCSLCAARNENHCLTNFSLHGEASFHNCTIFKHFFPSFLLLSLFLLCSQLSPQLQYFGQSLSGGQDLTRDGLADLAVGAQGHILLLRSQPVLRVVVTMEFTPKEVARDVFECHEQVVTSKAAGEVRVCLLVRKSTRDRLNDGEIQSTITYDLALDPGRPRSRAIFVETKNSTLRQTQTFGLSQKCETLKLSLPVCVEDSVSPIALRLNYTLVGMPSSSFGNLRPVLAVDAQRLFTALFPFEKNCGDDNICQDDLSLTFDFMNLDTLVVGDPQDFIVTLTVRNEGEDSYGTHVTFYHPSGLFFRKVSAAQNQRTQRSWRLSCDSGSSTEGPVALKSTSCIINHPIFPGNSEVTFNVTFNVEPDAFLGNQLLLKANVTSENNMPRTNKTEFQLQLPVKYAVVTVVTSTEVSTKYLNFTASEKTSHVIQHQYQFNNLGQRSLPINVTFWVPVQLNHVTVWDHLEVIFSQNVSSACHTDKRPPTHSDFQAVLKKTPVVNCSIAVCQIIQCEIPFFGIQEDFNVVLKGNLSFDWYIKTSHNHLLLVSTAEILFNDSMFALLPGQGMFVRSQTETKVEPYEIHNPLPLIVGSSIGGLVLLALITAGLYKVSPGWPSPNPPPIPLYAEV
uniref:Integrin subunit alpha M n=1 Tax=Ictidomys tridecemlineatus TaxID=43179 RepID=I3M1T4_ICTTR